MYKRKNFYMVVLIFLALSLLAKAVENGNQKRIEKINVSTQ
ncbi:hypothetical protein N9489_00650 [Methylophilaceae bacterium]|jgi:hypothetical protein|nr:hypothetical protein [Methylophilaceae bacterium]|tara:strand:+ start:99 stop:221 length:123 start_codon:yes stop_codon:yes gene_type:complete